MAVLHNEKLAMLLLRGPKIEPQRTNAAMNDRIRGLQPMIQLCGIRGAAVRQDRNRAKQPTDISSFTRLARRLASASLPVGLQKPLHDPECLLQCHGIRECRFVRCANI
jgi:hypothetical protein